MATGFSKWLEDLKKNVGTQVQRIQQNPVDWVNDVIAPDFGGQKRTFTGNAQQMARNPRPTANWLNDIAAPDFGGQKRTWTGNFNQMGADAGRQIMKTDFGRNVAIPFITGAARPAMGVASLFNPQAGRFYNQQRDAVIGNATSNLNLPVLGKVNPYMLAGDIVADPTTYVPFGKAGLLGKTAIGAGTGAASGFLTPAESMQERQQQALLGGALGGVTPAALKLAAPAARTSGRLVFKGGKYVFENAPKGARSSAGVLKRTFAPSADDMLNKAAQRLDEMGLREPIRADYQTKWKRNLTGSRADMRRLADDLGLPPETQKMSVSELRTIFDSIFEGKELPKQVAKKLELSRNQGGFVRIGGDSQFDDDMVKAYAKHLKSYDDAAQGPVVQTNTDRLAGYDSTYTTRVSDHSPFYSKFYKEHGRKPSLKDWQAEARRQLESGNADPTFLDEWEAQGLQREAAQADEAYLKDITGSPVNEKEAMRELTEWERSIKRETLTPYQNVQRQNRNIRIQNQDRRRLNVQLAKEDPLRKTGAKLPIKPNVTDRASNFPSDTLSTAGKDKSAFSYQRESLLRNIEETFGRGSQETKRVKEYLLDPIIKNETNRTRMVNRIRGELSELMKKNGIKRSSKADYAAADYIEGARTADDLRAEFGDKAQGIIQFAEEGRGIYKDLLQRTNEQLTKYGYDPIPERQNYVTHTTQLTTFWDEMGNFLNFDKDKLPTAMSSINTQTKPGKQFNPFSQRRQGGSTHEGLATAMDKYLDVTTSQMFHTADVQRARAIQNYLQRQADSAGDNNTRLSNFTDYIGQYADMLAGKKSMMDRPVEKIIGRGVYKAANTLRQRFGANAVGGSISSAVTNFIPLTQSLATTNKVAATKGLLANMKLGDEALIDGVESAFLRRRFPVARTGGNVKTAIRDTVSGPFQLVDKFSAKSIVAGKFYEGVQKGLDPQTAMSQADEFAARVLSDRSLGQSPLLFNSQTLGLFTQFQNEVNNQVSFIMKDVPKNLNLSKTQVASALIQMSVYAHLYNAVYEKMNGRKPAVDPIDYAMKALQGDFAGAGEGMLNAVPFAGSVGALAGADSGRIPMSGGIPNLGNIVNDPVKELTKPLAYFVPPYAGGQIKKTVEGLTTYAAGGDFAKDGDTKFQVEGTPANLARSALFGKWSTPEAQTYIKGIGQTKPASKEQTPGISDDDPTNRLKALKEEKKRVEKLASPGFLREGVTDEERASMIADIDAQITMTKWDEKLSKVSQGSGVLSKQRAERERSSIAKAAFTAALDGELTHEQATEIIGKTGMSVEQAEFAYASGLNDTDQAAYVFDKLESGEADLRTLIHEEVLTANVAKKMAEAGLISWDEYDGLKNMISSSATKSRKSGPSRGRKAKKISISIPKTRSQRVNWVSLSNSSRSPKVALPKFKQIQA